jgi:hypothetical protein
MRFDAAAIAPPRGDGATRRLTSSSRSRFIGTAGSTRRILRPAGGCACWPRATIRRCRGVRCGTPDGHSCGRARTPVRRVALRGSPRRGGAWWLTPMLTAYTTFCAFVNGRLRDPVLRRIIASGAGSGRGTMGMSNLATPRPASPRLGAVLPYLCHETSVARESRGDCALQLTDYVHGRRVSNVESDVFSAELPGECQRSSLPDTLQSIS